MNFQIISSLLIVAATAVLAVLQGNRITTLKEEHVVLEKEATALGISLDGVAASKSDVAAAQAEGTAKGARGPGTPGAVSAPSDPEAEGKAFARELFAFWKRVKDMEKSGEEPSREDKAAMFAFVNRFLSLDAEVIPHLMTEIRNFEDMDDDAKREILGMALMTMAQSAPEKAMELYINSGDLFGENRRADHMVGMALGSWAAKDPRAAIAWLDLNSASLKDSVASSARTLAIANAFKTDPDYAVTAALEMEKEHIMALSQQLGGIMQTPDHQLALLRSVQDRLGPLPTDLNEINEAALERATNDQVLRGSMLVGLGSLLARESFEAGGTFLGQANLTPVEAAVVAKGVTSNVHQLQDPGSWLPWLQDNTPEAERQQTVSNVVRSWTNQDFRATADWIGTQPPGPLRETATLTFAETVAPHEPASAADWALTLPPSEERTELLQNIHSQWQGKDKAAADAFATEHGLAPPPQ